MGTKSLIVLREVESNEGAGVLVENTSTTPIPMLRSTTTKTHDGGYAPTTTDTFYDHEDDDESSISTPRSSKVCRKPLGEGSCKPSLSCPKKEGGEAGQDEGYMSTSPKLDSSQRSTSATGPGVGASACPRQYSSDASPESARGGTGPASPRSPGRRGMRNSRCSALSFAESVYGEPTPSFASTCDAGSEKMRIISKCITEYTTIATVQVGRCVNREWANRANSEKWLHKCVLQGSVLKSERVKLWRFATRADDIENDWKEHFRVKTGLEAYEMLKSDPVPPEKANEIGRDVPRTFPTHPSFQSDDARRKLSSVLLATFAAVPNVGYCQGMNFVVAVFLLHTDFDEAQTTWLVLALLKHYSYDQLYSPGVPLLPLRTYQFAGLIKKRHLRVFAHLQANSFSVDIFSHQWMMTLFAYIVSPELLADIWNVIFLIGWKAIFQFGLGIVHTLSEDILKCDSLEDISIIVHTQTQRIKKMVADTSIREVLINLIGRSSHFVSSKELEDLGKEFMMLRWDAFLSHPDVVPPGFTLIPNNNGTEDLQINADAFLSNVLPAWRHKKDSFVPIPKLFKIDFKTHSKLRRELADWDATVSSDVDAFTRRIAASHRELEIFDKKHCGLRKDVSNLKDKKGAHRQVKRNLIDSLFASSIMGSPHKKTMKDLHSKIVQTERSYVDISQRLIAKEDQWTPVREELDELRMKKQMLMDQLASFLSVTAEKRQSLLYRVSLSSSRTGVKHDSVSSVRSFL